MNSNVRITPQETFGLHELIAFQNICATKASAMSSIVKDDELKTLMQNDVKLSKDHMKELEGLLKLSDFAKS